MDVAVPDVDAVEGRAAVGFVERELIVVDCAVVCEEGRGHVCAIIPSYQYGIDRHAKKRLTSGHPSLTIWRYS